MKIRRGDRVRVISGKNKGKEGEVIKTFPKKNMVLVEGANVSKKHQKQVRSTMQAGIIDKDMPIHISNVMLIDADGQATRVGIRVEDGKKIRFSKKTGADL
jgi:large subunit ribosomal protein L24